MTRRKTCTVLYIKTSSILVVFRGLPLQQHANNLPTNTLSFFQSHMQVKQTPECWLVQNRCGIQIALAKMSSFFILCNEIILLTHKYKGRLINLQNTEEHE